MNFVGFDEFLQLFKKIGKMIREIKGFKIQGTENSQYVGELIKYVGKLKRR